MRSTFVLRKKKPSTFWEPHSYQEKGMKWMLQNGAAFILWDPGLGKTSCTLGVAKILLAQKMISKVLVIAPLRVCQLVWPAEVTKWKDFHGLRMVVLHGSQKDALLESDHDIAVINPDGLEWLFGVHDVWHAKKKTGERYKTREVDKKRMRALGYDMLVVDESTQFKHSDTQRFKLLKESLNMFQRRYCLTGTPASNGLEDLFGQVFILDGGGLLGRYVTHFREKFFDADEYKHKFTPKLGAEERIYELLKPLAHRLDAKDHLKLPSLITTPDTDIIVELPPDARRQYEEMEAFLITQLLDGTTVTAFNAAVKSGKLRQIAAGGIYKDHRPDGMPLPQRGWDTLHMAKLDALEELVESLQGKPLLVGIEFEHDLDRLRKRFGKDVPAITGATKDREIHMLEDAWNAGKLPLLAGHPKSMGHGLNLQECAAHVCWLTTTWNLELYEQFYKRVWRQGNTASHVYNYHIIAARTVDEAVMMALRDKAFTQNALLAALKQYALDKRIA